MAIFFNGQCCLANTLLAKLLACTRCKIQFESDRKDKIKWQELVSAGHVIINFLPLIGCNLLLIYYRFVYKDNFYKYVPLLHLGPNVITDIKDLYYTWVQNVDGWDFYYAWVQMLLQMGPLLHLGPVITLVPSTGPMSPV